MSGIAERYFVDVDYLYTVLVYYLIGTLQKYILSQMWQRKIGIFFVFCSKNFFRIRKCRQAAGIRLFIFYAYIHFYNPSGASRGGMLNRGYNALKHREIDV